MVDLILIIVSNPDVSFGVCHCLHGYIELVRGMASGACRGPYS